MFNVSWIRLLVSKLRVEVPVSKLSNTPLATLLSLLVSILPQLGCWLLWRLSQFGQAPFAELPVAVILIFGALFAGPFGALLGWLEGPRRTRTLAGVVLLNLAVALLLPEHLPGSTWYVLAPLVALALALAYPVLFARRAPLAAAITVYVACTLLATFTFDSFLPLPGYGLLNVGTLFFGVTFTQRDRVHRYGRRWAYRMIALAAVCNALTALALGTPLRYVLVGFVAIVLAETADTEVYQRLLKRSWWTRVLRSNLVSVPIDTVVFTVFAFAGESFASPAWMLEVILTDVIVKFGVGMLAAVRVGRAERRERALVGSGNAGF